MDKTRPIVISLGGSLVSPNGGIDTLFLSEFNIFIRRKIAEGWRFFIVVGGGATARHYIDAARKVVGDISDWDLDWLGIHATHLNAHIVKTIFEGIVHPRVIQNYDKKIAHLTQPLVIAAGWKPGWSTDYDAVILARDYGSKVIINMSNIREVYDKDPKECKDARPVKKISWDKFEKLVGTCWRPGSNLPFDPVATKLAKERGLTVYIVGKDLANIDRLLSKKEFTGTTISP